MKGLLILVLVVLIFCSTSTKAEVLNGYLWYIQARGSIQLGLPAIQIGVIEDYIAHVAYSPFPIFTYVGAALVLDDCPINYNIGGEYPYRIITGQEKNPWKVLVWRGIESVEQEVFLDIWYPHEDFIYSGQSMSLWVISDPSGFYRSGTILCENVPARDMDNKFSIQIHAPVAFQPQEEGLLLGFGVVPEPSSLLALCGGLVGIIAFRRRSR